MKNDVDRRGCTPPVTGRCAAIGLKKQGLDPQRLQRTRHRNRETPSGAVYVGRPTLWANPFAERYHIGHARSVILFGAWLAGDCSPRVLRAGGFSDAEIVALNRRRERVLDRLPQITGRNLQCWCPSTSPWCHAETLLRLANRPSRAEFEQDHCV